LTLMLDTNAYSALKKGHRGVADLVGGSPRLSFSPIVVGELLYGFARGSREASNRADLRSLLSEPAVSLVPVSGATAARYAGISLALKARGTPIPTNDIWIAAQAMEIGARLVSFDRHFALVEGLRWIDPADERGA
jgi:tRNA(fMet)-specific endonuclease VapC